MRYVMAKKAEHDEEVVFRTYLAESVRLGAQNKYLRKSYFDVVHPQPIDTRSGDEIAEDVINRLGLKVE